MTETDESENMTESKKAHLSIQIQEQFQNSIKSFDFCKQLRKSFYENFESE